MASKSQRVRTDTLMRRIFRADSLEDVITENSASMDEPDFRACLSRLCASKGMIPEHVIRLAQIDRSYGHQLFNGTRRPSRDKVLQLALGMKAGLEETQRLLRSAGKSPLYPRIRRDAAVLFCLNREMSVMETQELMLRYGMTPLGGSSRYEE